LARAQSRRGPSVTNLRHYQIPIHDSVTPVLIQLLDGSRDREELRRDLLAHIRAEKIEISKSDGSAVAPEDVHEAIEGGLERHLELLAQHALLVR
jgi:hypothetical protein